MFSCIAAIACIQMCLVVFVPTAQEIDPVARLAFLSGIYIAEWQTIFHPQKAISQNFHLHDVMHYQLHQLTEIGGLRTLFLHILQQVVNSNHF